METLNAADGTPLATVRTDGAMGVRWAIVTLLAPAAEAAPAIAARYAAHRVVTEDDRLVAALLALGGTVQRRGHDYEYDLTAVPPAYAEAVAPQGFRLSHDLDAAGLVEAHTAANPPGHPDHEPGLDHLADLRAMIGGEILGPLVPEASWQVEDAGGPCGAVLIVDREAPRAAWVVDVFVHPRHQGRGLGKALLKRALSAAAAAGHRKMGLVVSDGNPARAIYDSLGFRHVRSGTNVDLP